jgi:integrase
MSIERVTRKGGTVWRVRWRDDLGRERSRVLGRKAHAQAFDAEVTRGKRIGSLPMLDAGQETLGEFVERWWALYAVTHLSENTKRTYTTLWDAHIFPRLGGYRLRDLRPSVIEAFRAELDAGGVGEASIRKTLVLLQGVLQRAVEWEAVRTNPVKVIRKPPERRRRGISVLSPTLVEELRGYLIGADRVPDATLISLLAYAGLRPGEALARRWEHITSRAIRVEAAVAHGVVKNTKTGERRSVRLLAPLAADLAGLRGATPLANDGSFLFQRPDGGPWTDDQWRNWRRRIFAPAAKSIGLRHTRPYDLRHSFVSLLIHEGRSIVEVARQAGHSPTTCLTTYAHVFEQTEELARLPAEEQIVLAREERRRESTASSRPVPADSTVVRLDRHIRKPPGAAETDAPASATALRR